MPLGNGRREAQAAAEASVSVLGHCRVSFLAWECAVSFLLAAREHRDQQSECCNCLTSTISMIRYCRDSMASLMRRACCKEGTSG
jgi:hypothetical protein